MKHLQELLLLAQTSNRLEPSRIQAEHHNDKGPYSLVFIMGSICVGNCFTKLWSTKFVPEVVCSSSWSTFPHYLCFRNCQSLISIGICRSRRLTDRYRSGFCNITKIRGKTYILIKETFWCNLLRTHPYCCLKVFFLIFKLKMLVFGKATIFRQ